LTTSSSPASRPPADERDPDLIRAILPFLNFLRDYYFRTEVEGLEHIPKEGRFIVVASGCSTRPRASAGFRSSGRA